MTKIISNKNIRATAFNEFWGEEYNDSIYLWESAKRNLTSTQSDEINIPALEDIFYHKAEIEKGNKFTREVYHKYISILTNKLNEIHKLELSKDFWRTVFGYWLWRHICIVYDKYKYLSKLNIDKTGIKLLDQKSYYIPNDHVDYLFCFCNDFGVQQLVSQYYSLFKTKEFSAITKKYKPRNKEFLKNNKKKNTLEQIEINLKSILTDIRKHYLLSEDSIKKSKAKIVILGAVFTAEIKKLLFHKSNNLIQQIALPVVADDTNKADFTKRDQLCNIQTDNDFEYFLAKSFYYCFPKILLENFHMHYTAYIKDIKEKSFSSIASEVWISDMPTSIYIAIAKMLGRIFIAIEHASGSVLYNKNGQIWMDFLVSDIFLTKGWIYTEKGFFQGGYCNRNIETYIYKNYKKNILFVSYTRFPYLMAINDHQTCNKRFRDHLNELDQLLTMMPERLKEKFLFRPREIEGLFDVALYLELEKRNIKKDDSNSFNKSIMNSRIVIIDHLSTGLSELLMNKVPFLIFYSNKLEPMDPDILDIIETGKNCDVFHTSVDSLIKHLTDIYDNVENWWNTSIVQNFIGALKDKMLAPPEKTVEFFLSHLNKDKKISDGM